jgi:molecular chaperone DnaK (HSP70)
LRNDKQLLILRILFLSKTIYWFERRRNFSGFITIQSWKDQNDNIKIKCPALNKDFSPEEISAQVLRKLINDATNYLGQEVTQAVITVPAFLMIHKDKQRWMLEKLQELKF